MGKVEIAIYCCVTTDIFEKSFTEMVPELSSTIHEKFVEMTDFDWLSW